MKRSAQFILCAFIVFGTQSVVFAQAWKDAFDKGMEAMQRADNTGRSKSGLTEAEHARRLILYNSAAENFIIARENSRKMYAASTYFIATTFYKASLEESALGNDANAYITIKRAIDYWPELSVVPAKKFISEQRIRVNGERKVYNALGDASDWQHAYFKSYVRAMQLANNLKKYDEAISYAEFVLDEADTLHKENFMAWGELSKSYKNKNDNCQAAEFAMKAIEGAPLYNSLKAEDKEILKTYLPEMAVNVSPTTGCRFDPVRWSERAALSLSRLHNIDDQSFYVLLYGKNAYNRGRQSAELLVALAEAEYYQSKIPNKDENEKTNWFAIVEEREKKFNSEELKRVANLYKVQGKLEQEKLILKKSKRKRFWENTHFGFSTNPANIYWGQYLGVFDFMLPRFTQEFRVNYNTSSRHYFWKDAQDKSPGPVEFYFSGYELSYTLKIMEKDKKGVNGRFFYSGPQFRVENREYFPVKTEIVKNGDFDNKYEKTINASSNRYEALLMVGMQRRSKWFFLDYFFGIGTGYKTLEKSVLEQEEIIADDRFRPGLWNKFFVPVHTGVRIGFILK